MAFAIHRDVLPRNKRLFEMMHQSARVGGHDQWSICGEAEPTGNQSRANEMGLVLGERKGLRRVDQPEWKESGG